MKWEPIYTRKEGRQRIAKASIFTIAFNVRMFDKYKFSRCFGEISDGASDVADGVVSIAAGIGRLAYMLALYAVWPISKPIMCAVYRKKFREWNEEEGNPT